MLIKDINLLLIDLEELRKKTLERENGITSDGVDLDKQEDRQLEQIIDLRNQIDIRIKRLQDLKARHESEIRSEMPLDLLERWQRTLL